MEFKPYSALLDFDVLKRNHRKWIINEDWIVQEKVKGVPFSLWMNSHQILGATRDRFLDEDERYFNWKEHRDRIKDRLRKVFNRVHAKEVVIYGELFGGYYPDEYNENAQPLNRGVYYSDVNDWYAHDIVIDGVWQPQWFIYEIFDELGITYAFELEKGPIDKVMKFNHVFPTEIPELFDLHHVEGNLAHGVVIRPATPRFGLIDEGETPIRRLIFKRERNDPKPSNGGAAKSAQAGD